MVHYLKEFFYIFGEMFYDFFNNAAGGLVKIVFDALCIIGGLMLFIAFMLWVFMGLLCL